MHSNTAWLSWFLTTQRWRSALLLLIGLVPAGGQQLYGADAVPPRWHASSSSINDCQLAVEARRQMIADPLLSGFNIGVTVADGVATVWGAVPNVDIVARVRSQLLVVTGITLVVDDLRIDPASSPSLPNGSAAIELDPPADKRGNGLAAAHPRSGSANFIGIVSPMTLTPGGSANAPGTPAVTLLKPTLTDTDLADQLETLRRSVPRFREVGIRSLGSVVYLRPYNAPPASVLELARQIAQLQGVTRVLIEDARRQSSLAIP
jgi:hypothetical protein